MDINKQWKLFWDKQYDDRCELRANETALYMYLLELAQQDWIKDKDAIILYPSLVCLKFDISETQLMDSMARLINAKLINYSITDEPETMVYHIISAE